MALSKRAKDALGVLEQEAQGNSAAASALASVSRALSGNGPDEGDRDTPGRRQSRDITKEGRDNLSSRPGRASGEGPKASSSEGRSNQSATDSNSPSKETKLAFLRGRRRGTAQKG